MGRHRSAFDVDFVHEVARGAGRATGNAGGSGVAVVQHRRPLTGLSGSQPSAAGVAAVDQGT